MQHIASISAFPALGMIVVDLVPPQNRGAAIGACSMFTDVSLCVIGPIAGFLVAHATYPTPFLFGGVAALVGGAVVLGIGASSTADRAGNTTTRSA